MGLEEQEDTEFFDDDHRLVRDLRAVKIASRVFFCKNHIISLGPSIFA